MDISSINNSFTYHPPTSEQIPKYEELRSRARVLALFIYETCPQSAETTLAIRHLEEAIMWANKSIACNS